MIHRMSKPIHITILGGGPAGLAVGYYSKKNGLPFTIYEASNRIGGNAITVKHGDFLFDSGAHRFHDKDAKVTKEIKNLIGEDLKKLNVPSQIYHNGKYIDFPLSPLDLFKKLGLSTFIKAGLELVSTKVKNKEQDVSFESFTLNTYGKTIAERFLLNYSEKLWGVSCDKLSPKISGKRLKGLNLRTFLMEAIFGKRAKTEHLDGLFYYPKMGYGTIVEKLAEFCGEENICKNSRITRIFHDHTRIEAIEINGNKRIDVDEVVSTLPLPLFLKLMDPPPKKKEVLFLANELCFRNLIIVAVFLNKDSITENGSIYFPDPEFPFTRIYEPKNRSKYMCPPGKTSLCAEINCHPKSELWNMEEEKLTKQISAHFINLGWIKEEDIIDTLVTKLSHAYPILEIGFEKKGSGNL